MLHCVAVYSAAPEDEGSPRFSVIMSTEIKAVQNILYASLGDGEVEKKIAWKVEEEGNKAEHGAQWAVTLTI